MKCTRERGRSTRERRSAVRARRARARSREESSARPVQRHVGRVAAPGKFFRQEGSTRSCADTFFTNPPLCITDAELREGFAIIDRALEITDRAVS